MEQHIVRLSLISEGATEKVSQMAILLKSVYNKNLCFNEQKMNFFNIAERLRTKFFIITYYCI
jgi:hypothetical protein